MTEVTKVNDAEIARRESYIRAYNRHLNLLDPFTWPYPYKSATTMVVVGMVAINLHNTFFKKPWNFNLLPRLGALGVIGACGYFLGTVKEHHYRTRDAVLEHYQELHGDEFVNVNDRYGRAFADVILPWYPRRADNRKF